MWFLNFNWLTKSWTTSWDPVSTESDFCLSSLKTVMSCSLYQSAWHYLPFTEQIAWVIRLMQKITSSSHCPREHFAIGWCSLYKLLLKYSVYPCVFHTCLLFIFINSLFSALFKVGYQQWPFLKYYLLIFKQILKKR